MVKTEAVRSSYRIDAGHARRAGRRPVPGVRPRPALAIPAIGEVRPGQYAINGETDVWCGQKGGTMVNKRISAATVTAMMVAVTMAGCSGGGQPKTAASFCRVYQQQKSQYLAKYGTPSGTGLGDLVQLVGAMSDWVPMFQALDQAAPPAIEPDVHNILDSLQQQEKAAGQEATNPLGGLASGLMAGLMASSSWNNLSAYVQRNCGTAGG